MNEVYNAPCMGCRDRAVGCHGSCEKYQAYLKTREAIRKSNYQESVADQFTPSKERGLRKKLMEKKSGRVHER